MALASPSDPTASSLSVPLGTGGLAGSDSVSVLMVGTGPASISTCGEMALHPPCPLLAVGPWTSPLLLRVSVSSSVKGDDSPSPRIAGVCELCVDSPVHSDGHSDGQMRQCMLLSHQPLPTLSSYFFLFSPPPLREPRAPQSRRAPRHPPSPSTQRKVS